MYDWNATAHLPDFEQDFADEDVRPGRGTVPDPVDSELEAAIEYKLAVSGFDGVAEIIDLLNRSVRRRWVNADRI